MLVSTPLHWLALSTAMAAAPTPVFVALCPHICLCRRQLWLYCGVYDFGGLQQDAPAAQNGRRVTVAHAPVAAAAGRWPPAWRGALGRAAAATPLLVLGWEQFKPDEMMENLASELGSRLTKLGPAGEATALTAALAAELGVEAWQHGPVPAPLVRPSTGGSVASQGPGRPNCLACVSKFFPL